MRENPSTYAYSKDLWEFIWDCLVLIINNYLPWRGLNLEHQLLSQMTYQCATITRFRPSLCYVIYEQPLKYSRMMLRYHQSLCTFHFSLFWPSCLSHFTIFSTFFSIYLCSLSLFLSLFLSLSFPPSVGMWSMSIPDYSSTHLLNVLSCGSLSSMNQN